MRSLAEKQQQTNNAQVFASGRHSGTCALVVGCETVFYLYWCNYVKFSAQFIHIFTPINPVSIAYFMSILVVILRYPVHEHLWKFEVIK